MKTCLISLNTLERVKLFVEEMQKEAAEYQLVCGRYIVSATSILGILSLNLNMPLELRSKDAVALIPEHIRAEFAV